MKSSKGMILAVMSAILAITLRSLKKSGLQRDLNPWPRYTVRRSNQLSYETIDATDMDATDPCKWLHS